MFSDAIEREQRKQTLCLAYTGIGPPVSFFSTGNDTVESVVGMFSFFRHIIILNISENVVFNNKISHKYTTKSKKVFCFL